MAAVPRRTARTLRNVRWWVALPVLVVLLPLLVVSLALSRVAPDLPFTAGFESLASAVFDPIFTWVRRGDKVPRWVN